MGAKKKKGKGRSWLADRQRSAGNGPPVAPGQVSAASDRTFQELVLRSPEPVLVDFWAEWCGPCKQVGPVVEELARDFAGRARMVKVDVDKNPKVSSKFSIRSIPTLMVFKDGEPQQTLVGAQGKRDLTAAVEAALG